MAAVKEELRLQIVSSPLLTLLASSCYHHKLSHQLQRRSTHSTPSPRLSVNSSLPPRPFCCLVCGLQLLQPLVSQEIPATSSHSRIVFVSKQPASSVRHPAATRCHSHFLLLLGFPAHRYLAMVFSVCHRSLSSPSGACLTTLGLLISRHLLVPPHRLHTRLAPHRLPHKHCTTPRLRRLVFSHAFDVFSLRPATLSDVLSAASPAMLSSSPRVLERLLMSTLCLTQSCRAIRPLVGGLCYSCTYYCTIFCHV